MCLETIFNHEVDVTRVYKKPKCSNKMNIPFFLCENCLHGQILIALPEDYYDHYELIRNPEGSGVQGSYTETQLKFYKDRMQELRTYAKEGDCLMDIGCGPGIVLKLGLDYFQSGFGIEPSRIQAELGEQQYGLQILNGYFDDSFQPNRKITAFLSTQVLEHLPDPGSFLKKAYDLLEDMGVGYLEVPNGQKIMGQNQYYDVFPEHINYYSVKSFSMLLYNAGFEIIRIGEEFNANFISAYVRKRIWHVKFQQKIESDRCKIKELISNYEHVAVWGAGTKARSFMNLLESTENIRHIFDRNPNIQGYYLCNSSVPIEKPTKENVNENDLILIFALQYKNEILKSLQTEYQFQGTIFCMDEEILH